MRAILPLMFVSSPNECLRTIPLEMARYVNENEASRNNFFIKYYQMPII